MMETSGARTCRAVAGRHVLAIQDTTVIRVDEQGIGLSVHPVLAVDAAGSFPLGLVDLIVLARQGGQKIARKVRNFEDKDRRRWLDGARSAARLSEAGAACVTAVEDREGDVYACFAFRPAGVEKLVRAGQDRCLKDGSRLFEAAAALPEAGRMTVELPAAPGRKAREALIVLRFGAVELC
jgi:hypothetical protein